jgi:hypothetical protein
MSDTPEQMTHKLASALADLGTARDQADELVEDLTAELADVGKNDIPRWLVTVLLRCRSRATGILTEAEAAYDRVKAVKDELEKKGKP